MLVGRQLSGKGTVTARITNRPSTAGLVCDDVNGHYKKPRRRYLYGTYRERTGWRQAILAWLRDHIHRSIPRWYYQVVLGHDLHISTYATLYVRIFHHLERDPFHPERVGWWENLGLVSHGKVTTAFRDLEVDALQGLTTPYADYKTFKYHRPGTDNTAESNAQTALITDCGLEATGTLAEGATSDIFKSVATVTADATETWQEHSIRSQTGAAGGTMMDRSLISPTVPTVSGDTVEFTYQLTKSAEA